MPDTVYYALRGEPQAFHWRQILLTCVNMREGSVQLHRAALSHAIGQFQAATVHVVGQHGYYNHIFLRSRVQSLLTITNVCALT